MKRLILAGFVITLFSGAAFAQNNSGYTDDVYYNGSQAQQDAKAEAKRQKKQQQQQPQQDDAAYYNSSTGTGDGYAPDGNAQVYNDPYSNDDTYIDYDDDSYTSRIRRFYYPMYNTGYWGGVYSPFWYDPFYSNPYYGWGGWYTPGFSIGWGGGPYWNSCWGMNTWWGYGMFNSWYYPYYGGYGGWGYGGGYWNGYYAGMYDGGRYNAGYGRGVVNYGPRGSRSGLVSVGNYGRNSGMRVANTGTNTMVPSSSARNMNSINRNAPMVNGNNGRAMQVDGGRPGFSRSNNNDAIQLNNSRSSGVVNQNQNTAGRQPAAAQQEAPARRSGFFNNVFRGNSENSNSSAPRMERSQSSQPAPRMERSYSAPAPSRSYSSPAPSRSSFGGGGGGGRMGGGRR